MKKLVAAAILFAATTACADSTAPNPLRAGRVAHDMDVNQTEPSALATVNPCNNDAVALTGTLHTVLHTTDANSGNTHYYIDFTSSYSGTGAPSLVNYQGSTRTLNDFTTNDPYPIIYTIYQDVQLQSQTSIDNYTLSIHVKFTINANGVVTASIEDFTDRCGG